MQFVPSFPPPIPPGPPEEGREINGPAAVKKVEDVLQRPETVRLPKVPKHVAGGEPGSEMPPPGTSDMRRPDNDSGDRRVFCRRIKQEPLLDGLRSQADRRRNRQRRDDPAEHVDVEA